MEVTELDELQSDIATAVAESGEAWFSTVRHQGMTWLRMNLVNIHTREHHIRKLVGLIAETANQQKLQAIHRRS